MSAPINKLFILSNAQENIIMSIGDPELKQMAKHMFNRSVKEIKKLNKFVNAHLQEDEIVEFDEITDKVLQVLEK